MPSPPPTGPGLVHRRLRVADRDVVWLRAVIEAYEGLAALYGDGTGQVELIASRSREAELEALLADLALEAPLQRL